MSQYNFSGRDYTFNVTLYEPITITFIPPTPNNGGIVYGHNVSFAIVSSGALTNASLMFDGVSYWMFQSTSTLWTLGLGGVPYGNYYFNATGSVQSSVNVTSNTRVISLQEYPKGTYTMNNSLSYYSEISKIYGYVNLVNFTGYTVNMTCIDSLGDINNISVTGCSPVCIGDYLLKYTGLYTCYSSVINDTYELHNTTTFLVSCPLILNKNSSYYCFRDLNVYTELLNRYYDIGDDIIIWVNISDQKKSNQVYAFGSDNTTQEFYYLYSKDLWFTYFTIKQKQDIVQVQSYYSGVITGIGEVTITINPLPIPRGVIEQIISNLPVFVWVIIGVIFLYIVIRFLISIFLFWLGRKIIKKP